MAFIDFAEVKGRVSFADAIDYLGLRLNSAGTGKWRGPCPTCEGKDGRALVVTEGAGWFCNRLHKGGDVIALAAHTLELPAKEAAIELAKRAGIVPSTSTRDRTVPADRSRERRGESSKLEPLSYLEHAHEAVVAIGFDTEKAKALGIGYAPRGMMRGTVAIPIRDEHGILQGYIGIEDAKLPPDFQSNVIPLQKRA